MKIVHGEQALRIHRPIPAAGTVIGRTRIKALVDKGKDKGALLIQERSIVDKASGALLATLEHTTSAAATAASARAIKPRRRPRPCPMAHRTQAATCPRCRRRR